MSNPVVDVLQQIAGCAEALVENAEYDYVVSTVDNEVLFDLAYILKENGYLKSWIVVEWLDGSRDFGYGYYKNADIFYDYELNEDDKEGVTYRVIHPAVVAV